jgi:hypothetical protein
MKVINILVLFFVCLILINFTNSTKKSKNNKNIKKRKSNSRSKRAFRNNPWKYIEPLLYVDSEEFNEFADIDNPFSMGKFSFVLERASIL